MCTFGACLRRLLRVQAGCEEDENFGSSISFGERGRYARRVHLEVVEFYGSEILCGQFRYAMKSIRICGLTTGHFRIIVWLVQLNSGPLLRFHIGFAFVT